MAPELTELTIAPPDLEIPTCCAPRPVSQAGPVTTKFHFSLNVSNLAQSVAFYEKLFGVPPAKSYPDYAKFELEQPPLVFSLVPNTPAAGGALSHLGFPVASKAEVDTVRERLTAAGLQVSCQDNTTCGYARQDKIWVSDPDQHYWEVYVVHEDIDPAAVRSGFDGISPVAPSPTAPVAAAPPKLIWEHRVTEGLPAELQHTAGTVDEVRLTGSFNAALTAAERRTLLQRVFTALKPGGLVSVHGLVTSQTLGEGTPNLPGVAALVQRVPVEHEPLQELAEAGLVHLHVTKLPIQSVFQHGAAELREVKLAGQKPVTSFSLPEALPRVVVFKGPFAATVDDSGQVYRRGERVTITPAQWENLARSPAVNQFLFIDPVGNCATDCSCG